MTIEAPVARGTRLEQAQRTLEERRVELEKLRRLVLDSFEAEDEARLKELRTAPTQRTEQVGGLVSKIRTQRDKNEARANALERDCSGLERLVEELRQDALEQTAAEEIGKAQELVAAEKAAWTVFAQKFVELHTVFTEALLPAIEARDSHVVEVEARQPKIVDSEAWAMASAPYVSPVPVDMLAAFEQVFQAAADPFGRGYRQEGGERSDDGRVLPEIVPDLRASNRAAVLSGKVAKKASSAWFAYGNQPIGSGPEVARVEREDGLADWHRGGN